MLRVQNNFYAPSRLRGDKKRCKSAVVSIRYDMGYRPIKFYLKQYSSERQKSQIVLAVTVQGKRFRVYTRMKVEPAFWDRDAQRCLDSELLCTRVRKRTQEVNDNLDKIVAAVEHKDRLLAEHGEYLSFSHIRSIIVDIVTPSRCEEKSARPIETLRKLAEDYADHLNTRGQKGASSSSQTYLMAIARLERFVEDTGYVLNDFSCFNKNFFDSFKKYLIGYQFKKGDKELKYTANTVLNTISVINNLTRKAYDMNLGGDSYYKGNCSILHEAAVKIYLDEKELGKLRRVETRNETETQVRDMFIIASYTALRISDINRLNNATFSEESITLQQKKTKNCVCVPILKAIGDLVYKYRNSGFPVLNESVTNACIKELTKRAGINDMLLIPEIRGGDKIIREVPKYSQVSFHTARRSCITNLYKRGYSANYLMSLSGHKSIASFQRYVKSDASEMSREFIKELRKRKDI